MRIARHAALLLALAAVALVGCGGSDDDGEAREAAEAQATPAQAVAEIAQTRQALDAALVSLRNGASDKAQDTVAEGYLQHFEKVEGPLEKVDKELSETIEDTINEEIREKIKDGASVAEVKGLIDETKRNLRKAAGELEQ